MRWIANTKLTTLACLAFAACVTNAQEAPLYNASYGSDPMTSMPTSCGGDCGLICVCEPETRFSAEANLLWLCRGKTERVPLLGSPANVSPPTSQALGTEEMEFRVELGIDLSLRAKRHNGQTWELRYFGIYDQEARERRTYSDGDLDTTNDLTIVHLNSFHGSYTDITTAYSSDLHSCETNLWLNECWGFEPVVGLRWMQQREDLESYVTTNSGEAALIDFSNDMWGAQLGVRRVLWQTPSRCRVEATLKAGAFSNSTQLDGEARTGGVATTTASRSFSTTSFVGELTISAVYNFSPNFAARIGYNGLWMDRVGLAADQIDDSFVAPGTTDLTTLIYQGGHFGLEYLW